MVRYQNYVQLHVNFILVLIIRNCVFTCCLCLCGGRYSVVAIVTRYGLSSPGFKQWFGEAGWEEDFRTGLRPTEPLVQQATRLSPGAVSWRLAPTPSTEVKESVELYLYSSLCSFLACYRVKYFGVILCLLPPTKNADWILLRSGCWREY
jgi:hypothetical protein